MPTIPQYKQQVSKQVIEPGVRQSRQIAAAPYQAVEKLAGDMLDASLKFDEVRSQNQADAANLRAKESILALNSKVKSNPGKYTPELIDEEITRIGTDNSQDITSEYYRNQYSTKYKLDSLQYAVQMKAEVNEYAINEMDFNTKKTLNKMRTDANRVSNMDILLKQKVDGGLYNKETAQDIRNDTIKRWALEDADQMPEIVLQRLEDPNDTSYPLDIEEKGALIKEVGNISKAKSEIRKIDTSLRYEKGQMSIYGDKVTPGILDNPSMTYSQKVDALNTMEKTDTVDSKTIKTAKAALLAQDSVGAATNSIDMQKALRMVGDLQQFTVSDSATATSYLKRVQEARNYVQKLQTNKKISQKDKADIISTIDESAALQKSQYDATAQLATGGSIFSWGYNDAYKYISDNLENEVLRAESLREYFYKLQEKDGKASIKEKKQMLGDIIDSMKLQKIERDAEYMTAPTFANEQDMENANLPNGTPVILNGVKGVYRK